MANQVTIDVEARFIDNVSGNTKAASKSFDDLEKNAKEAAKEIDKLGKKKADPKVDANTSPALDKLNKTEKKLSKLGNKKTSLLLKVTDMASKVIDKVTSKAKALGNKTYSFLVKTRDSNALQSLNKISNAGQKIAGKTWTAIVKIKDTFTAPLTTLKNALFNIRTLIAGIASAWAAIKFVKEPIALADAYSSAQIGFSTLLGESAGQQMMNDLDAFAKATPFKSSEVIAQTQRMLAMGWNAEDIIKDMTTIGDAASATGKGEQGLQQIVTALAQIKTKGKLSTEELNQLAEAGISAKRYIAEGLGYGSGDEGIAKMTKDLENGAIASGAALEALLSGMKEYQGMMDKTANETASGLWSQIEDTFEINIFRKWGQGLQDGAKRGFGSVVDLLNEAEGALEEFGDTIYEIGSKVSNWLADKFENAVKRVTEITGSFEFKNANLKEKISMLWNGVIVDPLKEWWEGGGQQETAETAGKIGSWIGEMLTKGLLALFGATDILDEKVGEDAGSNIAGSFLQGFLDNFDGSAITDAFVDAIGNVWGALPTWAKVLIGGYGVGKAAGGISNMAGSLISGIGNVKGVIGSANAMTGILGFGTSAAINMGAGNLAGGASLGAGALSAIGLGATAGGIAGLISAGKGIYDLYNSKKAYEAGDKIEGKALMVSGNYALGGATTGAATGAAIGSVIPGLGTAVGALIGAGIGGVAGWWGGKKAANDIRAAAYESEAMKEAIKDSEISAEELAQTFEKAKWENAKDHFGDIKLSMSEIQRLADQIVWGEDLGNFESFALATKTAEANLQSLKSATEETNRWMWKASLGVKFNDDEQESIEASFDEYVNYARSLVENKHYEFTTSASLILNLESDEGKSILEAGNAFYAAEQEKLEAAGTELGRQLTEALADGIISAPEEEAIIAAQEKIAEITEKISNAEAEAEMELIKIKFGSGKLDYESFQTFMETMNSNLQERIETTENALEVQITNLNLRYPDKGPEYEKELATIIDGYEAKVESIKADVLGVELNIIGDAYGGELGEDAVTDLQNALQYCVNNNLDPIDLDASTLYNLVGVDSLSAETTANLLEMLSGVYSQLELVEVDGSLLFRVAGVTIEGDTASTVQSAVEQTVPDSVNTSTTVHITPRPLYTPLLGSSYLPTVQQHEVDVELTGNKKVMNSISLTAADFKLRDYINHTIKVNVTAVLGSTVDNTGLNIFNNKSTTQNSDGSGYRGGIFGGPSAMDAFARGGSTDNGGIVGGSTRFIRVNEESPEMIIPLSSQRRERALKLWNKTGSMLGVPGFARGGRSDGANDEGLRFMHNGLEPSGGRSIEINLGGVNFTVQVSGGDKASIIQAIKEQAGELADYIVGVIAEELEGEFENTPTRGGVA